MVFLNIHSKAHGPQCLWSEHLTKFSIFLSLYIYTCVWELVLFLGPCVNCDTWEVWINHSGSKMQHKDNYIFNRSLTTDEVWLSGHLTSICSTWKNWRGQKLLRIEDQTTIYFQSTCSNCHVYMHSQRNKENVALLRDLVRRNAIIYKQSIVHRLQHLPVYLY